MTLRFAFLALPLALAACDQQAMNDFRLPWDKPAPAAAPADPAQPAPPPKPAIPEPTGASPTEQPLQVAGETVKVATADAETVALTGLSAAGTGWTASVAGDSARFERAGGKAATVKVRRITYSGGTEYIGTLADKPFVLRVKGADCGGQPLSVTVKANNTSYEGCGSPSGTAAAAAPSAKPGATAGAAAGGGTAAARPKA